jgi:thymidylate synthase ThyX
MINIINITGLTNAVESMGICTDTKITDVNKLLNLIGSDYNKYHKSIFEHIVIHFEVNASIKFISQANRHKMIAISQKSTRYAMKKLNLNDYITGNEHVDKMIESHMKDIQKLRDSQGLGITNDILSYALPAATVSKVRYTQTFHDFCMLLIRRNDKKAMEEAQEFSKIAILKLQNYEEDGKIISIYYEMYKKIRELYFSTK